MLNKIALGSVQFGLDYGVSNTSGKTNLHEVRKILDYAEFNSISLIDSAPTYGDSEKILGNSIKNQSWDIVTKTQGSNSKDVIHNFIKSLSNLKMESVYGLLVHDCKGFLSGNGSDVFSSMKKLSNDGFVKKIGFSVYNTDQIYKVLDKYDFDLIQLPVNILDQRMIESDILSILKNRGVEIHARSVFLQGLLLMDVSEVPVSFNPILKNIKMFGARAKSLDMSKLELAINFVSSINEVDKILVGVSSVNQLVDINNMSNMCLDIKDFVDLSTDNSMLLNPSNWRYKFELD